MTTETEVPASCGTLDAAIAAKTTIEKLDNALRATFKALGPVDTSITLARVLSIGSEKTLTPSADGLEWLDQDVLPMLRDALVSQNVETAEGSKVVFRIPPEVACRPSRTGMDAGAPSSDADPACLEDRAERPSWMAISRVACGTEDNVHGSYLFGNERKEALNFDLVGTKLILRIDVGEIAASSRSKVVGSDAGWKPLFDQGARGKIEASADVLGPDHVRLTVHVSSDIELARSEQVDGGAPKRSSLSMAAHAQVLELEADASTRRIEGALSSGAIQGTMLFTDFIRAFNRSMAPSASPSETVQWAIPSASGQFSYRGEDDSIRVTGLGLGDVASRVLHGADSILSWEVNPTSDHRVDFVATGQSDGKVVLALPGGFDLRIHYGLQPVKELVTEPWPFSLDDDVKLALTGTENPSVVLLPGRGDKLNLVDDLEGSLFQVTSGTFEATSRVAPGEAVSVPLGQCLNRHESEGAHELLQHLSSGACESTPDPL